MAKRKRVTIVIRAFNEARHIGQLLASIRSQEEEGEVEVVLVDSGSTDGTPEIAEPFGVRLVRIKPERFSFGYALNRGIEVAGSPFILLISAHCYPQTTTWIRDMLAPFEDKQVALVYGKQRGVSSSRFSEHQIFHQWFPDEPEPSTAFPFCNNANAAIRRNLWEKFPYNEQITGLEDIEWAKRVVGAGFKICYRPEAGIYHIHEERFSQVLNRYRREAIAFRHIFPDAHFGLLDFVKLCTLNVCVDYAKAFAKGRLLHTLWDIPAFRIGQFWGAYLGNRQRNEITRELRDKMYYPAKFGRRAKAQSSVLLPTIKGEKSKP